MFTSVEDFIEQLAAEHYTLDVMTLCGSPAHISSVTSRFHRPFFVPVRLGFIPCMVTGTTTKGVRV